MSRVYERRDQILYLLSVRRHDTIVNLAEEFGVNERTIRRDMESLCLSYPIYTSQGKGGGIFVMDGFSLRMKFLSDEQAALLERISHTLVGIDKETMEGIIKTFKKPVPANK